MPNLDFPKSSKNITKMAINTELYTAKMLIKTNKNQPGGDGGGVK